MIKKLKNNTDGGIAILLVSFVIVLFLVAIGMYYIGSTTVPDDTDLNEPNLPPPTVNWWTEPGTVNGYATFAARMSPDYNITAFFFSEDDTPPKRVDTELFGGYFLSKIQVPDPGQGGITISVYGIDTNNVFTDTVSVRLYNYNNELFGEYL